MESHFMLDIETLGVRPTSVVLSVAFVKFTPGKSVSESGIYRVLDRKKQSVLGRTLDQETLDWWNRQSQEARKVLDDKNASCPLIAAADFNKFIKAFPEPHFVWAKSPAFDVAIMKSLYEMLDMEWPFTFNHELDVRTAMWIGKRKGFTKVSGVVAHNALADAKAQIQDISVCV